MKTSLARRLATIAGIAFLALGMLSAATTPAGAKTAPLGFNGDIKTHDLGPDGSGAEANPLTHDDPFVCTFHLHGFNFDYSGDTSTGATGAWWIEQWSPGDNHGAPVDPTGAVNPVPAPPQAPAGSFTYGWTAAADQTIVTPPTGFMNLPNGHYKVWWVQLDPSPNPPGTLTPAKHKVFWDQCAAAGTVTIGIDPVSAHDDVGAGDTSETFTIGVLGTQALPNPVHITYTTSPTVTAPATITGDTCGDVAPTGNTAGCGFTINSPSPSGPYTITATATGGTGSSSFTVTTDSTSTNFSSPTGNASKVFACETHQVTFTVTGAGKSQLSHDNIVNHTWTYTAHFSLDGGTTWETPQVLSNITDGGVGAVTLSGTATIATGGPSYTATVTWYFTIDQLSFTSTPNLTFAVPASDVDGHCTAGSSTISPVSGGSLRKAADVVGNGTPSVLGGLQWWFFKATSTTGSPTQTVYFGPTSSIGTLSYGLDPLFGWSICEVGRDPSPKAITGASNASPIVITAVGHGYNTGDVVTITGIVGTTNPSAANGTWTITKIDADTFSLNSSTGNGDYVSGGSASTYLHATMDGYVQTVPANSGCISVDPFTTGNAINYTFANYKTVALTASKTATGSSFTWSISKTADKTFFEQNGGTVTANYSVLVTRTGSFTVSGNITVTNPNPIAVSNVSLTDLVKDGNALTDAGATCTPNPTSVNVPAATWDVNNVKTNGTASATYSCTYSTDPTTPAGETNTVTASWDPSGALAGTGGSAVGTAAFSFTDYCAAITDSFAGNLGSACGTKTITYSRTINVPSNQCIDVPNTAMYTTNTTGTSATSSASVKVCGAVKGALTMGFWQNKNGQGIITSYCNPAASAANNNTPVSLYTYLTGFNAGPFKDLTVSTCSGEATYVYNLIKAANASGATMNAMVKAQMLATALDVYFSDPALGGNKIGATVPIGGLKIDLTQVCKMIDGTGGTATCSGTYQNVSAAFNGATALTVSQILSYAASQSSSNGSSWYGQVKATQEMAKNVFDAINNNVAFIAP